MDEDTNHKPNFPNIMTQRYGIHSVGMDFKTGIPLERDNPVTASVTQLWFSYGS